MMMIDVLRSGGRSLQVQSERNVFASGLTNHKPQNAKSSQCMGIDNSGVQWRGWVSFPPAN